MPERKMPEQHSPLTVEERERFHEQGYLGPYRIFSSEEMAKARDRLFGDVFLRSGPNPLDKTHSRHLDEPLIFSMVSHPGIVGRLNGLLGPDLMVWTTGFFIKQPHQGLATPWHQDINYWPLEPQINLTIWLAIEDVREDSSPLYVIPGSHRKTVPHIKAAEDKSFSEEADPAFFEPQKAIPLVLKAGEFVLFSERLLHYAPPNRSAHRRTALAARYTIPLVRLFPAEPPINFPGYHAIMVSGTDRYGQNPLGPPPTAKAAADLSVG